MIKPFSEKSDGAVHDNALARLVEALFSWP
jgi:hypothetical protein